MLGDRDAGAGGDERRRRRDVEGRDPAAGTAGVDERTRRAGHRHQMRTQDLDQSGKLLGRLPLGPQRDQKARGLDLARLAAHDQVQHLGRAGAAEVLPVEQAVDRA